MERRTTVSEAWRPGWKLVLFALVAFAAYLVIDLRVFGLETRFPDEERFIDEALAFARSGEFRVGEDRAWEMPLLGVFYGFIYKVVGTPTGLIAVARCVQAVLLVGMAWLAADLARRLFSDSKAAALAFVGVLVYPMFVVFQALLLSETLFTFLLVLGAWCLYRWAQTPDRMRWLAAYAAAMAAATYTKASLTWVPLILPLLLLPAPLSWRRAAGVAAVTALVYCACLSPWCIRNAQLFGEPVWFTTSSRSNLYLGNNPANVTASNDWSSDVEQPFATDNDRLPELERDRRYGERALAYIRADPSRFVTDAGRKFVRLWNIFPNHEAHQQGAQRWIVAISYGPALILALLAVWLYRDRWRWLMPIYALFAYFTLVHVVTIASLRYRLPLEAFLVVFAAGAVAALLARRRTATAARAFSGP
jgi:4-amino-4-deoxy-L-arabinose transferase-like glycosyltransferase